MLESDFEKDLALVAGLMGCIYFKIPDTRSINKETRSAHKELKRPFDSVFICPNRTFVIEAKIESRPLKAHQRVNMIESNRIRPGTGFVLRKYKKYIKIDYHSPIKTQSTKLIDEKAVVNFFKKIK